MGILFRNTKNALKVLGRGLNFLSQPSNSFFSSKNMAISNPKVLSMKSIVFRYLSTKNYEIWWFKTDRNMGKSKAVTWISSPAWLELRIYSIIFVAMLFLKLKIATISDITQKSEADCRQFQCRNCRRKTRTLIILLNYSDQPRLTSLTCA